MKPLVGTTLQGGEIIPHSHDDDGGRLLKHLRKVLGTHIQSFEASRDHIQTLLGSSQNFHSGIFRESLLRSFLRSVLPQNVNIDTGFVYGFEQVPTSGQLDILVWDSQHPPVYRTNEIVIVPPEAAIAAISVKTTMKKADIEDGIQNLMSLAPIDLLFRAPDRPPIEKIFIAFHSPKSAKAALRTIAQTCQSTFATVNKFASVAIAALENFDPINQSKEDRAPIKRLLPKLFASIDNERVSFSQGWGPPEDILGQERLGPHCLRRLPWIYSQTNYITTPLEKAVFYTLQNCYLCTGTTPGAMLSAWLDLNPIHHARVGDLFEITESEGAPMLDPHKLAAPAKEGR